ncbi:MAG: hypothetical protein KDH88_12965 [Chromatiales bacterium]|nr:hypothetical protein [Chromatiales bacterium]
MYQKPYSYRWAWVLAFALLTPAKATLAGWFGDECPKVERWMAVMNEWGSGADFNRLQHQQVRQLIAPAFHDDIMREVWGDTYAQMSDSQRASIHRSLTDCSKELWVRYFVTVPFADLPDRVKRARGSDFAQWLSAIQTVNTQPYASLKARRQQQVAAAENAAQRRTDARAAALARREQLARLQEERTRQAEIEAQNRIALVSKHADSGPFRGQGAAYLNALYVDDRDALAAYDRMFSQSFSEVMSLYKGSATDGLARLFFGKQGSQQFGQKLQSAAANLSMVTSVAGAYVLYYEHAYPKCMDGNPLIYTRTREYEWVTKNGLGQVLSRSPGWSVTDKFHINHRHQYIWEHMGDIEKGNAVMTDLFLGKPGAIRLTDALTAMTGSMQQFTCDSQEMRQLESRMLSYFKLAVGKMRRAVN